MASEELHVIGILDDSKASGSIKIADLRTLLCDYLQLGPYYNVLLEVLSSGEEAPGPNKNIDIQDVFKALASAYFNRNIPSFYNNRITKYTVKMLKAGIVTYIRGLLTDGASAHQMKEFETLSIGVPLTVQNVHSMLWVINKTISNPLLEKWIQIHAKHLDQPGTIMVHEFLYLLCNCVDKHEMIKKIPKVHMDGRIDKKTRLFHVDKDAAKIYETPDHKIQQIMKTLYNMDKVTVEGIASLSNRGDKPLRFKSQPPKNDPNQSDKMDEFRKQLREKVLTVDIKTKLKEYHQKLIRSRLNGKSAYEKLVFVQGEKDLPTPLDLQGANKVRIGTPNNEGVRHIPSRPMTAQHKTSSVPSSPRKNSNIIYKAKPYKDLKILLGPENIKDTINLYSSKSSKGMDTIKFHSRNASVASITISPNSLNSWKKNNLSSTNVTGNRESVVISKLEKAIDEEWKAFEENSKVKNPESNNQSIAYFNSARGSSTVRIYSSRPNSPRPPTPLASKLFC